MRTTYALIFSLCFCSAALAQTTGDGARGSTPPGMSHDGAAPADGAIKGGSIVPGEQGGLPGRKDATATTNGERLQRCAELTGVLRTDCLQKERSAAGGSSAQPQRDRDNDERDLQK